MGNISSGHKLFRLTKQFVTFVIPLYHEAELPEAFLRYDHAEEHPFHPMPQGIPVSLAYRQLLLLKAETAFRLHLYSEVKSISACLGGKYKHIEKLINNITDNDNL